MSTLAWASIGFGCLIIATRGPFLFAPEAAVDVFRRVIETATRVRILGLVSAALGVLLLLGASAEVRILAVVMSGIGWAVCGAACLLVLFPGAYQSLANWALDNFADAWRGIGLLGVLIGIAFIWAGLTLEPGPVAIGPGSDDVVPGR